ncbi:MAG: MarR family transcriptional regulator, partial [Lactococcus sp.]|nr:MarR family transcriptional regulator [Lactococcus sp.]
LLVLWEKDNIKLYELGQTLDLSSNTLTPLLKRLEEKGYLSRIQPEKDKRQLVIQLTQAGKALQTEIQSVLNACFSEEIDFSPAVMQQMIADNVRLTQAIKADM